MPQMSLLQAINSAQDVMLERDKTTLVMGEDVGYFGGVFRATAGLQKKHGRHRVLDTPIAEGGIVAAAIGMGANGLRPIVEIQFADYIYPAIDQLVSEAATLRYRSNGQFNAPLTVRSPTGGGIRGGQTHSQSPEAYFTHTAGLKTVIPSNPYDAKGMLIAAIEDNDPVIFFEPKRLYNGPFDGDHEAAALSWAGHEFGEVPEDYYRVELGKARTVKQGEDVTLLTWGSHVHVALAAVKELDIDVEVIDLRSLVPLDIETITQSVARTGRCIVVHEARRTSGFGGELMAQIQEHCFYHLEAPIVRVCGYDMPYPHAQEWDYFPSQQRVINAVQAVCADMI